MFGNSATLRASCCPHVERVSKRQELVTKLRNAGCSVDTTGTDWVEAGDFVDPQSRYNEASTEETPNQTVTVRDTGSAALDRKTSIVLRRKPRNVISSYLSVRPTTSYRTTSGPPHNHRTDQTEAGRRYCYLLCGCGVCKSGCRAGFRAG